MKGHFRHKRARYRAEQQGIDQRDGGAAVYAVQDGAWDALSARHERERLDLVLSLRDALLTRTEATRQLGVSLQTLSHFVASRQIHWPVKRQGRSALVDPNA